MLDNGSHSTNRRCECDPTKGYYDPERENLKDDPSYSAEMPCRFKWPPCERGRELDIYGMVYYCCTAHALSIELRWNSGVKTILAWLGHSSRKYLSLSCALGLILSQSYSSDL